MLFVVPFGLCSSSTTPSGEAYRNTTSPSPSTRASCSGVATHCPSPCLIGISTVSPTPSPAVTAVSAVSTRRWTSRQMNRSDRLRISAPGSSPDSHRIWNPLQMPSTGPPSAENAATSSISGARAAIAPHRR
jgi:hypothetical protein